MRNDLDDDTRAFINCEYSIAVGSSQHLQGRAVPPLNHRYIKSIRPRHSSPGNIKECKEFGYDLFPDKCDKCTPTLVFVATVDS